MIGNCSLLLFYFTIPLLVFEDFPLFYHFNYNQKQNRKIMRRRKPNKKKSVDQQLWHEDSQEKSEPEEQADFISLSHKNLKEKSAKRVGKTKSKPKRQSKENGSFDSDSHQSQILDIRHADETTREHIRPGFLKRWDGQSNEFEIFPNEMKDLSPMLQVYWKVKCRNMKAIVFLEFGKMQFLAFQDDAIRLNEIFKKKLKKYSKFLMVNFWIREVEQAKQQLFNRKIPVLIMNEIEDEEYKQKYGLIRRQVLQVITPALHITKQDKTPRSRLLMALYLDQGKFQILLLDAEANQFFVEQFDENEYLHQVRRVINKYRPVQLIIPDDFHKQVAKIARQICNPYIIEINLRYLKLQESVNKYRFSNPSILFIELKEILQAQRKQQKASFSKYRIIYVLELIWNYLESLSLLQKIFYQGIFHSLAKNSYEKTDFFDSQVYENLQIFRIQMDEEESYCKEGTLIHYVNDCKTNHGKKLLHKWIDQPLTNESQILQRQEVIRQLVQNHSKILCLHDKLIAYQTLQKKIGDIYHWTYRHSERGKLILTKYLNYEKQYDPRKNPAAIKVRQIVSTLRLIKSYEQFMRQISAFEIKSSFLKKQLEVVDIQNVHLMTIKEINNLKCMPQIGYLADIILRTISYDDMTGYLQPILGQIEVYDAQKQEIDRINALLQGELQKWKEYYKTEKITYVSVRSKNQFQIPKGVINQLKQHKDLIFSSEIASFIRYTTPETYRLSNEIMEHQQAAAQSYEPFLQMVVEQFCKYRFFWDLYVQSMAKMDVFMSLAKTAIKMPIRCMPTFIKKGLNIQNGLHPNLLQIKERVIPNSISLVDNQKILLLTGPNMGGKSTFLKQICALAILAQIGSYVPADKYESIIYDQIFCRMGASDRIYQGKSTFYVQLQETKMILAKATPLSLIVIDQLGRGTSTYDGMAIAQAILEYILTKIKAITLYSTHYTQIAQRYKTIKEIKMMKMGYQKIEDQIQFTYQLREGVAQRSFANNVGKMVGLPSKILQIADRMAEKLLQQSLQKKALRQACNWLQISSKKANNASS